MNISAELGTKTFLNTLVEVLDKVGQYNSQDQVPPAAVLWPDKERMWEPLLPRLQQHLPIFTLGAYAPDHQTGPAYWLRCIIARTIPHPGLVDGATPILYLPGYGRQDVRAVETCPRELQPLAELQYRGVTWAQKNSRDWTIAAFLQSEDRGLGIPAGADTATRAALQRSLLKLAEEPVEDLRREAPIRAPYLDSLLHPDEAKILLRWLNDPSGFRDSLETGEWEAFVALCMSRYGIHLEKDGPITAAGLLGQRSGNWATVWHRFAESPAVYPHLPEILRQARPPRSLPLFDSQGSWPQENDAAEEGLRQSLTNVRSLDAESARRTVLELEKDHGHRRGWVWASLGQTPLANALEHLKILATESAKPLKGSSVEEVASAYSDRGWQVDLAVIDVLAAVETPGDLDSVRSVLQTMYRPWLEFGATLLQKAVGATPPGKTYRPSLPPQPNPGICMLFSDGLRYDVAQRLKSWLDKEGLECAITAGLAALPSITATAKPAVSPAVAAFSGIGAPGLEPVLTASGTKVGVEVFRKALTDMGIQVLRGEALGDQNGCAWTELGDIDSYGHEYGWRVVHQLPGELRRLVTRIKALLEHGWQCVTVVTDHGWLLLPGGLPKAELPLHLTEVRKGRCARLKVGSQTDQQVVPWHWDPSVRFALSPGIHCFEAGKEYEHGGLSPQECVVPIITVVKAGVFESQVEIAAVSWRRLRCNVRVNEATNGLHVDIRSKAGDPDTSLVGGSKVVGDDGTVALFVVEEDHEGQGAVVVAVGVNGELKAQMGTVVGGS